MLSHALTIITNELQAHLTQAYGGPSPGNVVGLGNIAEGVGNGGVGSASVPREIVDFSMVNVREEKTLKNVSNQTRNTTTLKTTYENPPVFLNFHILVVATHASYTNALLMLSRAIRFFQFRNVFDQDSVSPDS